MNLPGRKLAKAQEEVLHSSVLLCRCPTFNMLLVRLDFSRALFRDIWSLRSFFEVPAQDCYETYITAKTTPLLPEIVQPKTTPNPREPQARIHEPWSKKDLSRAACGLHSRPRLQENSCLHNVCVRRVCGIAPVVSRTVRACKLFCKLCARGCRLVASSNAKKLVKLYDTYYILIVHSY